MTWNRSSLLLLLALAVPAACGDDAPDAHAPPAAGPSVSFPLVRLLEDPDPAVRARAAEGLGRLRQAPDDVVRARLRAQEDEVVATAAATALDRLEPNGDVALRLMGPERFADVVEQV